MLRISGLFFGFLMLLGIAPAGTNKTASAVRMEQQPSTRIVEATHRYKKPKKQKRGRPKHHYNNHAPSQKHRK